MLASSVLDHTKVMRGVRYKGAASLTEMYMCPP